MSRASRITRAASNLVTTMAGETLAAIGVDVVDIVEFGRDVKFGAEDFLAQCFDKTELDHCAGDVEKLATRFALKEATLKALGSGIRGIGLHDISVETATSGEPKLRLSPAASAIAAGRHLGTLRCSATNEAGLALAVVAASSALNEEIL